MYLSPEGERTAAAILRALRARALTGDELLRMLEPLDYRQALIWYVLAVLKHDGQIDLVGGYDRSEDIRTKQWRLCDGRG